MPSYHSCTLSLYCDNPEAVDTGAWIVSGVRAGTNEHVPGEFPHVFHSDNIRKCRQKARDAGWHLFSNGASLCPRCITPKNGRVKARWD